MKAFIVSALLGCIFQFGNANEAVNSALKNLEQLEHKAQATVDLLKVMTVNYPMIINGLLEAVDAAYQQRADEKVKSILEEIKKKGDSKKVNACYDIAKKSLDELNVDSKKHLKQCISQTVEGVDTAQALDSLLKLFSSGKEYLAYIKKLKKDLKETKEESILDEIVKKVLGVAATFQLDEVTVMGTWRHAIKIGEFADKRAKQCSEKEYADLHTAALVVRENAFNCITHA